MHELRSRFVNDYPKPASKARDWRPSKISIKYILLRDCRVGMACERIHFFGRALPELDAAGARDRLALRIFSMVQRMVS